MKEIKLLLGGSPCTRWSIAQTKNRETEPSGLGWELFLNYVMALRQYKPDYFLYENNKSMSPAIKAQITKELGVEPILINSALVSAQNRQRYYWTNIPNVGQPEDKGILLRDVLETTFCEPGYILAEPISTAKGGKSFCITANEFKGSTVESTLTKHRRTMIAEPVCVAQRGRYADSGNRNSKGNGPIEQFYEAREDGKTNALTTVQKGNNVAECFALRYERTEEARRLRRAYEAGEFKHGYHEFHELHPRLDRKTSTLTTVLKDNQIIEPILIGATENNGGGAKTGLYTVPIDCPIWRESGLHPTGEIHTKLIKFPVYEVRDGQITIKDKTYPIKLRDGFYIIRKLTVTECKRLQTVPDSYVFPVSNTQAYKMLGNGWTVDVIAHILSHITDLSESDVEVLSMYDGMSCGHIALDKLGANVTRYYATEVDKHAIKTTLHNYPNTIQLGDAFQVRDDGWLQEKTALGRQSD